MIIRLLALLLMPLTLPAVELRLQFAAIERILGDQVFTQEGRRYVHGSKTAKCNFAYLEKPRVQGQGGRLLIHARFTGRSAANLFGQCVGLGDAFDLTISATPVYRDGNVGLKDVTVTSDKKIGFYIRRVCTVMASSLARDFRYPFGGEARKILEDPGSRPEYKRDLKEFNVTDVRVGDDAVVFAIDFQLTIR